jgi:hypothetical protein
MLEPFLSPTSETFVVPVPPHDPPGERANRIIRGHVARNRVVSNSAIANDELNVCVLIEPNQDWQAVATPRIHDDLEPNVREDRLAVLQDRPFKPGREYLSRVSGEQIGVLREVRQDSAVLRMQLKAREYFLFTPSWEPIWCYQPEVIEQIDVAIPLPVANDRGCGVSNKAARVKVLGVSRNTAGKTPLVS